MAEQPQFVGDSKPINVLLESRGFLVISIEMLILPTIIFIVILLLIYCYVIKKDWKMSKNSFSNLILVKLWKTPILGGQQ